MTILKATNKDISEIEKITQRNNFEIGRNFVEIIKDPQKGIFLAKENEEIAGFIGYSLKDRINTIQIINIFVVPERRRKGIGSDLVQYLLSFAKKTKYRSIIAEAPSKSNAPKLYLKNGFRKCGYNDRYYDNKASEITEFYSFDLK